MEIDSTCLEAWCTYMRSSMPGRRISQNRCVGGMHTQDDVHVTSGVCEISFFYLKRSFMCKKNELMFPSLSKLLLLHGIKAVYSQMQ